MATRFTCLSGHQWEVLSDVIYPGDAGQVVCPVCEQARRASQTTNMGLPANQPPPSPMPGDTVGLPRSVGAPAPPLPFIPGYEILGTLGRGGMGVVYKAWQVGLKRQVALKMILAGTHAGHEALERFRIEAEAVARLKHPNIVQIYEVGEREGLPYLALEFVDGGSLDQKLAGTPQPARASAELLQTLARAVHSAHQQGIVHRDLKPANVLLAPNPKSETRNPKQIRRTKKENPKQDGDAVSDIRNSDLELISDFGFQISDFVPKVTDFGLAKRLDVEGPTATDAIMGTPSYMAPEQGLGNSRIREVGPGTDIYALGAILYEMLSGRPPFQGESALDTLEQVWGREPVPPSQLQPKVPRDLETICLKCLRKESRKRYPTAAELADDLGRYLAGEPIQARPVRVWERAAKWAKRRPAVAALLAGIIGVTAIAFGVVLWQWQEAETARQNEKNQAETERLAKRQAEIEKKRAQDAGGEADRQRRQAQRFNVTLALERGLSLCERGEIHSGLLWLARSLQLARVAGAAQQEQSIRRLLARWAPAFQNPRAIFAHPDKIEAVAWSRDGRTILTGCKDHYGYLWDAATGRQIARLKGHGDAVTAVAISPNGKLALTGGRDKTARLWDPATGKAIGEPFPVKDAVTAVAFSRDNESVWTGSRSGIQRWEAATGKPVGKLEPCDGDVRFILFSPNGETFATSTEGSFSAKARLWDADNGKPISQPLSPPGKRTYIYPTGGTNNYTAIAFSPNSEVLVTGYADADLWDTGTGQHLGVRFRNPDMMIQAIAYSPTGKTILTGSTGSNDNHKTGQLWDAATGKPIGKPLRHQDTVKAVAFSSDGKLAVTGSEDQTAQVWDAATGEPVGAPLRHGKGIWFVAFGPGDKTILTAGEDKTVRLWTVDHSQPGPKTLMTNGFVGAVAFSPDGKALVTAGWDSTARLWDAVTGQPIGMPLKHDRPVTAVAFSPNGKLLLTGGRGGEVRFWEAATGKPASKPLHHPDQKEGKVNLPNGAIITYSTPGTTLEVAAFSPDGKTAATGSKNDTVQLWDVAGGKPIGQLLRHDAQIVTVAFSPDGKIVFTASPDKTIRRWDAVTGKPAAKVIQVPDLLWAMALSPDGKTFVAGGGTAKKPSESRLWNVAAGAPFGSPLRHQGRVLAAAFSPDGKTVLTGCEDGTARLWDAVTGKALSEPLQHKGPVLTVAFSRDSTILATGSQDGTARLWDAATGKLAGEPFRHPYPVQVVAIHPTGKAFATGSGDTETMDKSIRHWGEARFWRLPAPLTGDLTRIGLWLQVNIGMELDDKDRVADLDDATVRERWRELKKRGGPPRR